MPFKFVMMPPQADENRVWADRIRKTISDYTAVLPETDGEAKKQLDGADAAFGTIPADSLAVADSLKWLQAPAAASPAGYYYDELIAHPVQATNFREIYNDHISMFIMALCPCSPAASTSTFQTRCGGCGTRPIPVSSTCPKR